MAAGEPLGAAYHPSALLTLLVYGDATGVFSCRKIEPAAYNLVAFRFIAAGRHPDHDTLGTLSCRFLEALADLFVQVLDIAREKRLLKLGTISLDGTKIQAHASKHRAQSQGHIEQLEMQLKDVVEALLTLADQADQPAVSDGMSLPDETVRRQERLKAMDMAKTQIEARAKVRFEKEQAEYEGKLTRCEAKAKEAGKKPGGKPPKPPEAGPTGQDQLNLTDEASRIMPITGGGFEQAYAPKEIPLEDNAQGAADTKSMLVVISCVIQSSNDKSEVIRAQENSLLYPHH